MEERNRPKHEQRGDQRYVGGGPRGGQNLSNAGYGANQSYSAGPGYQAPDDGAGGPGPIDNDAPAANAPRRDAAVSPDDLGVRDYDLQGGYGRPPESDADDAPPSRDGRPDGSGEVDRGRR